MKINADKLGSFLELVNLTFSPGDTIKGCVLSGDKDKLSVIAVSPTKVVICKAELKGDFTDIGVIGLEDNLTSLVKLLNSSSGEVTITKTTNKLLVNTGKKVKGELILCNPQYVKNNLDIAKYNSIYAQAGGNVFTIVPGNISEVEKYIGGFNEKLIIEGNGKEVDFLLYSGENELDVSIDIAETVKKFKVKLAGLVMTLFGLLKDSPFTMSINDNASVVYLSKTTPEYSITYLVAPMVK